MELQIFERLSLNILLIISVAFLISRTKFFKKAIKGIANKKEKAVLILIFGGIGIIGTYIGFPMQDVLVNSRDVGVVVGGLFGGPAIGLAAGVVAGLHRYTLGGPTALSCSLATIIDGLLAGIIIQGIPNKRLNLVQTISVGVCAELIEVSFIILFSNSIHTGWENVKIFGLPMIMMNTLGICIFYAIVQNLLIEEERIGAQYAHKSLQIANTTLPILKLGLNSETAKKVAKIVFERGDFDAVAITDRERILAHVGKGNDHHIAGEEIKNSLTIQAIKTGEIKFATDSKDIGCSYEGCPLNSALIVPLVSCNSVIGTFKIYHENPSEITQVDWEFAEGLGILFSTQLELAELEVRTRLVNKVELKALQAQINPHFLFNALNTIVSLCRTDSEKARELLIQLGEFFRNNLKSGDRLVSLKDELEHVRSYLAIESARFSERFIVREEIAGNVLNCFIPGLTLQPLVENAVKHGIYPMKDIGEIIIYARIKNALLEINIIDNGVGIAPETLELIRKGQNVSSTGLGIGLNNVIQRLYYVYHGHALCTVESTKGKGTIIHLCIPQEDYSEINKEA